MFSMTHEMVYAFYDNASEETKEWLVEALFYRELESIRRDQPLLDPNDFEVKAVQLYDADEACAAEGSADVHLRGGARASSAPRPRRPPSFRWRQRRFYRFPWIPSFLTAKAVTIDLLDDDGDATGLQQQQPSGPFTEMRLDISAIRMHVGYTLTFEDQFEKEIAAAKADFLTTGYKHSDTEDLFQSPDWLHYLRTYQDKPVYILYKGFPMVEHVTFIMHPNYWTQLKEHGKLVDSGQCYWLSLALLIYGDASFWLRVKAEHLCFLERVLMNPDHPRHAFYARENKYYAATQATGPSKDPDAVWSDSVNLWERLQIPGCWTSEDMGYLTADVYGVFIVLYKYDSAHGNGDWGDKVYDMKTYGSYNSRHIFLCYTHDSHFQPMVPNDYYAYEFKLPRLTLESTKRYRLATRERRRFVRDGPWHHWRGPRQSIPTPLSRPFFEPEHLRRVAGYGPEVISLLHSPELTPSKPMRTKLPSKRPAPQTPGTVQPPVPETPPPSAKAKGTRPMLDLSPSKGVPLDAAEETPSTSRSFTPINAPAPRPRKKPVSPDTPAAKTFWKTAGKSHLTRLPVARLRVWVRVLLGMSAKDWKKERCVGELLERRVEVRMRKTDKGGLVVDDDGDDEWNDIAARLPVEVVEVGDSDSPKE